MINTSSFGNTSYIDSELIRTITLGIYVIYGGVIYGTH